MCNAQAQLEREKRRPGRQGLPEVPGARKAPARGNPGMSEKPRGSGWVAPGKVSLRPWASCWVERLGIFVVIPVALAFHGVTNTNGHIVQGDRDRTTK